MTENRQHFQQKEVVKQKLNNKLKRYDVYFHNLNITVNCKLLLFIELSSI